MIYTYLIFLYLLSFFMFSMIYIFVKDKVNLKKIALISIPLTFIIFFVTIPMLKNWNKEVILREIVSKNCLKPTDALIKFGGGYHHSVRKNGTVDNYDFIIRERQEYSIEELWSVCKNKELEAKLNKSFNKIDNIKLF